MTSTTLLIWIFTAELGVLASAVFVIFTHAFWLRAHDKQVRPQLAWGRQPWLAAW